MDIALIVHYLVPNAQYTKAGTYAELAATWTDARPIPTESAIIAAEARVLAAEADRRARPTAQEIAEALLDQDATPALDALRTRKTAAEAGDAEVGR